MASGQSPDVTVKREWLRHAAEQMEADNARRFGLAGNVTARNERLNLRGEAERPAVVCCVERLDAVRIACKEKASPRPVPNSKSEHPAESMNHLGTVARVEMQERFCVGGCAEACAVSLEFCAQLRIVVDFAVEHDDETAVFTGHRLGSTVGKVDD